MKSLKEILKEEKGKAAAVEVLPANHKLGMKVPKGGSSCEKCKFLKDEHNCGNKGFIKWNGSSRLPAPDDEYCCDLYDF